MIQEQGKQLIKNADKKGMLKLLSEDLGLLKLSKIDHGQIQNILSQYHECLSEKPEEKKG